MIRKKYLLLTRTPKRIFSELSFITDIACRSGGRELDHLQVRNLVHFFICSNDDFIDRPQKNLAPSFRRFFCPLVGFLLQIVCANCRENWTINEDEILSIGGGCFQKKSHPNVVTFAPQYRGVGVKKVSKSPSTKTVRLKVMAPGCQKLFPQSIFSSPNPSHLDEYKSSICTVFFLFFPPHLSCSDLWVYGDFFFTAFFFALVSWFNLANH